MLSVFMLRRLFSKNRSRAENFSTAASEFVSQKILHRSKISTGASELEKSSQKNQHRSSPEKNYTAALESFSQKILRPVKICSGASSELEGRPSLILPPSFSAVGGISKVEYNFYSPLKQDILRFNNSGGGEEEVDLMKGKRTYWIGSSHGWLVLFANYNMFLLNPVSGRRIQLPPFRGEPFLDKELPFKVILSHSPDDEDCRALAIYGLFDKAALCSPGRCDRWIPLGQRSKLYGDFVYSASRKSFVSVKCVTPYWLYTTNELEFWDVESRMDAPVKTLRAPRYYLSDPSPIWLTYLVSEEESGQLFMVRRFLIDETRVDYKVYSIDKDGNGRDVVQLRESLDGLVMFIGTNHCFAVKASRFPEYRPNCIYFSGYWFNQNQFTDIYHYHAKAYSNLFDFSSDQKWHFHSTLPWFTLTQDH